MDNTLDKLLKLQNGSDIRGIAMDGVAGEDVNLDHHMVKLISFGYVKWLGKHTGKAPKDLKVAIGRDSRLSGRELLGVSSSAVARLGVKVLDCQLASTPAMFMSTVFPETSCHGGIMVTASHLPWNRNGLKFFSEDGGLDKKDIWDILHYANNFVGIEPVNPLGRVDQFDLMSLYSKHLQDLIKAGVSKAIKPSDSEKPLAGLSITVDAGNGAGGFYAKEVLQPLGADVSSSQFLEPDGHFLNHQPNPENKEAMTSICDRVKECKSQLGLIFDTDVDRSSAVDEKGNEINRNGIIALAASLIPSENKGGTIVTDSTTSLGLNKYLTESLELSHLRYKRGYKNVINKAKELCNQGTNAPLAIETSGHAAFKENYFLDDGAYLATKIVIQTAILHHQGKGISNQIADFVPPVVDREYRYKILAPDFGSYGQTVIEGLKDIVESDSVSSCAQKKSARLIAKPERPNYEGYRINFFEDPAEPPSEIPSEIPSETPCGWLLTRLSLHDPILVVNLEAKSEALAHEILNWFEKFLNTFDCIVK